VPSAGKPQLAEQLPHGNRHPVRTRHVRQAFQIVSVDVRGSSGPHASPFICTAKSGPVMVMGCMLLGASRVIGKHPRMPYDRGIHLVQTTRGVWSITSRDRQKELPMPDRLGFVAQAVDTLGITQQRLVKAGKEFWAAMLCPEEWLSGLLEEAKRIRNIIPAGGPAKTKVERMALETALKVGTQVGKEQAVLVADIQQAASQGRLARR